MCGKFDSRPRSFSCMLYGGHQGLLSAILCARYRIRQGNSAWIKMFYQPLDNIRYSIADFVNDISWTMVISNQEADIGCCHYRMDLHKGEGYLWHFLLPLMTVAANFYHSILASCAGSPCLFNRLLKIYLESRSMVCQIFGNIVLYLSRVSECLWGALSIFGSIDSAQASICVLQHTGSQKSYTSINYSFMPSFLRIFLQSYQSYYALLIEMWGYSSCVSLDVINTCRMLRSNLTPNFVCWNARALQTSS